MGASVATWEGDRCDRKSVGDFLYKLAIRRFERHHSQIDSSALCIALDADWGAGKSFFIEHWSKDVEALDHLVIRFDAWKSDLSDDPLMAFLAQIHGALEPWIKKLPVAGKVQAVAKRRFKEMMRNSGRAALPSLGHLLKGAANHYMPGAIDLVVGEFTGNGGVTPTSSEEAENAPGVRKAAGEAFQKFIDEAVKTHADRLTAVANLKSSIRSLLTYLEEQRQTRLPLFVFVDELDRCRPDFAIRLLEGIKHLFDAPGICFVFSTNMTQLAASMQAVYGPNFDSQRYLKRFFSFEYLLPPGEPHGIAIQLAAESDMTARKLSVFAGLPQSDKPLAGNEAISKAMVVVADAFTLSLRSQKQVFAYADAATAALEPSADGKPVPVHVLYLLLLSALLHTKGAVVFDEFVKGGVERLELLRKFGLNTEIKYMRMDESSVLAKNSMPIRDLFIRYVDLSRKTKKDLVKDARGAEFPHSIALQLVSEGGRREDFSSIHQYAALVRNAGRLGPVAA